MADYAIPKSGAAYILYTGLVSQADTKLLQSAPTLATGDFKVSIDGGALANLATTPTNTPSGVVVKISLSGAEMTGDNITVVCIDAAGAEWCNQIINIQTAPRGIADLAWPTTTGRSLNVSAGGVADATLVSTGLDVIATTAPTGPASNFREMVVQTWRRFFKKAINNQNTSILTTYADDNTTVVTTQSAVAAGGVQTVGPSS